MTTKLYVGNLPHTVTSPALSEHFASVSDYILEIQLGVDKEGNFQGYCYLVVATSAAAEHILSNYNHSELLDRKIRIAKARHRQHYYPLEELAAAC